ncbi:hypothetical protein EDB19DRAFT_2003596 [Suillus lakei]|nr:hypothetical protein EDB19DRAFT_2003596 [Suillus lakei]
MPLVHAFTLVVAHRKASDFKKRVKARNEKWNDSELLKMAGADLMINYPANSFVVDVDLGYLTSLEARILENSEEAGIADNQQWGLDAGQHQRRWDVLGREYSESEFEMSYPKLSLLRCQLKKNLPP